MGIIVDTNAAHHLRSSDLAGVIILDWLLKGKGKLIVSKTLLKELSLTHLRSTLVALDRASRLIKANDIICENIEKTLNDSGNLQSNDAHVVALVIVSLCEVVFTHDKLLHRDLKDRAIVVHRCSIFQDTSHAHLLNDVKC